MEEVLFKRITYTHKKRAMKNNFICSEVDANKYDYNKLNLWA